MALKFHCFKNDSNLSLRYDESNALNVSIITIEYDKVAKMGVFHGILLYVPLPSLALVQLTSCELAKMVHCGFKAWFNSIMNTRMEVVSKNVELQSRDTFAELSLTSKGIVQVISGRTASSMFPLVFPKKSCSIYTMFLEQSRFFLTSPNP